MSLGLEIPNITFLIAIAVGGYAWLRYLKRPLSRTPPIVSFTRDERTKNLLEALERHIQQHGPVIGLRRDGRVEYIVSDELTPQVLTGDATFSFELGTAKILKIEFLPSMFGHSIFQDIDSVINTLLTKHLDTMVHRGSVCYGRMFISRFNSEVVSPIFERNAVQLLMYHPEGPVNLLPHLQRTIAEAVMSSSKGDIVTP
ncbi:hypothetical protein BDV33DRAFT_204269 [Aspergillus novoparasiticus]|uniref:Uncharacterized protein n=1 Tax=Aspergillus novoparasiticus TaxID=986946 RepID=A0A5N6EQH4_9EURO|nr:hypothetical protein BDV33DRAFT_204269 [Aspergillus novoparasiticus]